MKNTQRVAAAAAALVAVGLVGVAGAESASAAPARINASQLKAGIAKAVTAEQSNTAAISTNPTGYLPE